MKTFAEVFRAATGSEPYGYQARIARDGLPAAVWVPTGAGKTGVILAWLWRRLYGPDPGATPRRLVYALPQRSLLDQVSGEVRGWLANLGLADEVALHVVTGARWQTQGEWRDDMHKPAIVVGPADVLVSKALVRGFDVGRTIFPIDFALVSNGAHWIIDEVGLCPQTTATLRQLAGFAARLGTAEPSGLTGMSALAAGDLPRTAGHPEMQSTVQILQMERTGVLATRLAAAHAVRRLPAEPGDQQAITALVSRRHRPGTLTLVVMNTVHAARGVYRRLRSGPADCTLLHGRFRGAERERLMAEVMRRPGDRIVVCTQVIEAGLDLEAALLVTEAAPWPALLLRAGRCIRGGPHDPGAEVWWVPPPEPFPYQQRDIDAAVAELGLLEGTRLTAEDLLARNVPATVGPVSVLGPADLAGLFDTSPDPSGDDVDITRWASDTGDVVAEVAWAAWAPGDGGAPDPEVGRPRAEYRCRVSLGDIIALAQGRAVWRFDRLEGAWTPVTPPSLPRLRPGELLLVNAADGGYEAETGFDLSAPGPVPGSPELLTPAELADRLATQAAAAAGLAEVTQEAEEAAPRRWLSLDEHSSQVRDQAAALLAAMAPPGIPPAAAASAIVAGYLHDAGKAHEIWQDAICALAEDAEKARIEAGRPWAKSGGQGGALLFAGGVAFRHELASLLLIDGPLCALLARSPDPDLTRYLVLAHHGKLRVRVRAPGHTDLPAEGELVPAEGRPGEKVIRGLRPGATTAIPAMLGQPASTLTVDLDQFQPGGDLPADAWTRTVLGLRDRYGPFVLAYLETVVRVADWRASGGSELPGG